VNVSVSNVISLKNIIKVFGDVTALNSVSVDLRPAQIHALLGANGSGKSTLVKILTGAYNPNSGSISFDGKTYPAFETPSKATALGIRVIHQEAPLIDTLSVAEAVAIFRGYDAKNLGLIRWRQLHLRVQTLLDKMDVPVLAKQSCKSVGPADRAGLALAISVGDLFELEQTSEHGVKLLIVDEVTGSIPETETGRHLARLRAVADLGVSVLMVTHRLSELVIADDLTILSSGKVVYREDGKPRLGNMEIVEKMIDHDRLDRELNNPNGTEINLQESLSHLWNIAPLKRKSTESEIAGSSLAISLNELSGRVIHSLSLDGLPGEIIGFAGLRGGGVDELPLLLSGEEPWTSGEVKVGGVNISKAGSPRELIQNGIAAIPSDRLRAGGVPSLSVEENIILPTEINYWHKKKKWNEVVSTVIETFDVRPTAPKRRFSGLSGGNQQKVLLGKWFLTRPTVLVLDDPTYGVDPAAREIIFEAILNAASRGICVLFFSTEPAQLVRICHRILVIRDGEIMDQLTGSGITLEKVMEESIR
jgi:ribose transport system ATP-binding protein